MNHFSLTVGAMGKGLPGTAGLMEGTAQLEMGKKIPATFLLPSYLSSAGGSHSTKALTGSGPGHLFDTGPSGQPREYIAWQRWSENSFGVG